LGVLDVSSYRFCRTDDIDLLVGALNRCWLPYVADEPPVTAASFKRSIRDLQVWCSSCMVAMSGSDPIGVLIGAKRPTGTLIFKIAVHPDHLRQGHGRHLLESLSSKLAILGPPRIVAEVPETLGAACGLFGASGYAQEAVLTDYDRLRDDNSQLPTPNSQGDRNGNGFVIPITIDDLAANDLLQAHSQVCWERSIETLIARKDEIAGLAVASDERIEACVLFAKRDDATVELLTLRSFVDDGRAHFDRLLAQLQAQGIKAVTFPKVHPSEVAEDVLGGLGFRPAATHRRYDGRARSA
jgi:GNAT superfamily N-acetyltransferase